MENINDLSVPPKSFRWINKAFWAIVIPYCFFMVFLGATNVGHDFGLGWIFIFPIWLTSIAVYAVLISVTSVDYKVSKFRHVEYAVFLGYAANYFFIFAIGFSPDYIYYSSNLSNLFSLIFNSFLNPGYLLFIPYFIFLFLDIYKNHKLKISNRNLFIKAISIISLFILINGYIYISRIVGYANYQNEIFEQNERDTENIRKAKAQFRQQLAAECETGSYIRGHVYVNGKPWPGGFYVVILPDGRKIVSQAMNAYTGFQSGFFNFPAQSGTYTIFPMYTDKTNGISDSIEAPSLKMGYKDNNFSTEFSNVIKVDVDKVGCFYADLHMNGEGLKAVPMQTLSSINVTGVNDQYKTVQSHTSSCSNVIATKNLEYKNDKLNFGVSYPNNLKIEADPNVSSLVLNFNEVGCSKLAIRIDNVSNDSNTLEEYWKSHYGGSESGKYITINNQTAFQIKLNNGQIYTSFLRKSDNQIFNISLWESEYLNIYNDMLKSFSL